MKILHQSRPSFSGEFSRFLKQNEREDFLIEKAVRRSIQKVRRQGDVAVRNLTLKFDGHFPKLLEVSSAEIRSAYQKTGFRELQSLRIAAQRIKKFHTIQFKKSAKSWRKNEGGILVGERILPLDRVGIYVPGGLAAYPSTVLMNALPAKVAGVKEILMVSPWTGGNVNPYTLVSADIAGVDHIFKIGGAQAISALAYGTQSIPAVDKIVGPGNIYVATAKRLVFGKVAIDMIAGPSEVVVVADETANPSYIASDLLSQAEHDPQALVCLITPSLALAEKVLAALKKQLKQLPRQDILKEALQKRGMIVVSKNREQSLSLANRIAPEHLEIQLKKPEEALAVIQNAGAVFLGNFSPVAFGDYLAGSNHVLPTSGTSRFSSPLGVRDFLKSSSLLEVRPKGFANLASHVMRLARLEGLTAHEASVRVRMR